MCIIVNFTYVATLCIMPKVNYYYPPPKAEGYRFGVVRPYVTNLLGLYFKDYNKFEHEISGVYRSHWGEVHCTRTTTIHFLILELLPFVIFHTWILSLSVTNLLRLYLNDYYRFEHETSGLYRSHWVKVHCTRTITLHFLISELLSFVFFSYLNFVWNISQWLQKISAWNFIGR